MCKADQRNTHCAVPGGWNQEGPEPGYLYTSPSPWLSRHLCETLGCQEIA